MKHKLAAAPRLRQTATSLSRPRPAAVLLAATLGLTAHTAAAAPAQAAAIMRCSGNDWKCDNSGYAANAHRSFWMMYAGHNCTNYVAYRLIRDGVDPNIDYMHNGGDWAEDARQHGIPVNGTPIPGAAAQWNPGAGGVSRSGHVAYVETVGDGWIDVAEDNYSSGPMSIRRIHTGDAEWPSNFVHFPRPALALSSGGPVAGPQGTPTAFNMLDLFRSAAPKLAAA